MVDVQIETLKHYGDLPLPEYQTALSAGMDLAYAGDAVLHVHPGQRLAVPTGIKIALPEGYEAQIRPRSGLALKKGITVVNAPGTIDADYRGEILVALINLGQEVVTLSRGMRIAQMIVAPVSRVQWQVVETLPESARGEGGFGHTGS